MARYIFELFRFSLFEKEQDSLLYRNAPNNQRFTRETWLVDFFSREHQFIHHGSSFVFAPVSELDTAHLRPYMFGRVARPRVVSELTAPPEGLQPTLHDSWQGAIIIVDPTHHEDGQKVALQRNDDVGRPAAIVRSLVKALNEQTSDERFAAEVFPVLQERSFARWAAAHGNSIERFQFVAAVPNMFGGRSNLEEDLRRAREEIRASKVSTVLESEEELNIESQGIQDTVEYAERGGGQLSARATDGAKYSSKDHSKSVRVQVENERSPWAELLDRLDRIF